MKRGTLLAIFVSVLAAANMIKRLEAFPFIFPPMFDQPYYIFDICAKYINKEHFEGIGKVTATTMDTGPIEYFLSEKDSKTLNINKDTGMISLAKPLPSDVDKYLFEVEARNELSSTSVDVLINFYRQC